MVAPEALCGALTDLLVVDISTYLTASYMIAAIFLTNSVLSVKVGRHCFAVVNFMCSTASDWQKLRQGKENHFTGLFNV